MRIPARYRGWKVWAKLKTQLGSTRDSLPNHAVAAISALINHAESLTEEVNHLERRILNWHRTNAASRRLAPMPGIGPITASVIAANVPDASLFRSARQITAWLGLTLRAHSSGGKDRRTGISKQGDGYTVSATSGASCGMVGVCGDLSPDLRGAQVNGLGRS
ncbi:transposase [Cereibacter changlensis]